MSASILFILEHARGDTEMSISSFERLLQSEEFVVTCEIALPRGTDTELLHSRLEIVHDYCDAMNITDNVRGISKMSSLVCAHLAVQAGVEPILQMCTRDRNRIAIQSDLLGAYALGIHNLLFMTGDIISEESHPNTKSVFDLDSIQALDLASLLMSGFDLNGEELDGTPQFHIGATLDPIAESMENQISRLELKVKSGAKFFQTQAIYDVLKFKGFLKKIEGMELKIIAGVIPLKNPEMARFMHNHVMGVTIPEELIERIENAGSGLKGYAQEDAFQSEGLEIALELVDEIKNVSGVNGLHIMGVGWVDSIPEIVKRAGLFPRLSRKVV